MKCFSALHFTTFHPLIQSTGSLGLRWRDLYRKNKSFHGITKAIDENSRDAPNFDYLALRSSSVDLQERFVPSKVQDIVQYHDHSLALKLKDVTGLRWLTICWNPLFAHIGTLDREPRRGAAAELYGLGELIKRNLRDMILIDVLMPEKWERVVKLSFSERLEDPPSFYLYIEIMNRHSNLVFCDHNDEIVCAANQIGSKKSSQRQVQTRRKYQLPPIVRGLAPDEYTSYEEWKECLLSHASINQACELEACISRSFRGVGPAQAREIISHSKISAELHIGRIDEQEWAALFSAWLAWLEAVEDCKFCCHSSAEGNAKWSVFQTNMMPLSELKPLEFFGGYYNASLEIDERVRVSNTKPTTTTSTIISQPEILPCLLQTLASLKKIIQKEKDRQTKKLASLQKQKETSVQYSEIKLRGDLIMSSLHLLKPGTSYIEVDNWETGKRETIKLDPQKSGIENAEVFYKQAKKAKRGAAKTTPLIEETQSELNFLEENEVLLSMIRPGEFDSTELLYRIEDDFVRIGYIKRKGIHNMKEKASKAASKKKQPTVSNFRRLVSPNGLEVLVGRSSQENDIITMKIAKPGDVWMHARGYPGAHVLIKCSQSVHDVSSSDLQFAADIAAFHSKASMLSKVDVIMADKKNISKPKGAKPGQVLVHKERVIVAHPGNAVSL